MGMADVSQSTQLNTSGTNTNVGPMIHYRWHWRRPQIPFAPTKHCGVKTVPIRRFRLDSCWRCPRCAARIEPERLNHRLMLWWNPFRRGEKDHLRRVVQVYRGTIE